MRHALLLAQRFDKRDGRHLRVRAALREAGYNVDSLAFDSGGDENRDPETRDLRPKASMLLMLFSQLVMASVITGYFMAFYPSLMTIIFWLLISSAVFFGSTLGGSIRNMILHRIAEFLARIETAKRRYKIIWTTDPETLRLATRLANCNDARLIFDAHEYYREESPENEKRKNWVIREENNAIDRVNYLVTVNDQFGSFYKKVYPACDPVVIRNAVDPQTIDKYSSPLRTIVGAEPTHKIILYHGSMRSLRHLRELAGASIHLPQNWKMVFLGIGPIRSELERISHRLFFLDPVPYDELFKWLAGADLGAILYEGFGQNQQYCSPNKLYEYIGCGIPILTTDILTLAHYSETLGCGFIIKKPTQHSIAEFVAGINVEQLNRASENCKIIAKQFSWELEKKKIMKIISDV